MYLGSNYNREEIQYNTLSPAKMREIHSASLQVLEEKGMVVQHAEALEMLKKAGAAVEGDVAYLPASMVEAAIKTAPSRVTVYDRNGKPGLYLENRNIFYGVGSDTPNFVDYETRTRRPWTKKDIEDGITLCDYLDNIDFVMSMGIISDVDKRINTREQYSVMTRKTTKPQVVVCDEAGDFRDVIKMAAAVRGGVENLQKKPYFVLYAEPTSPLVNPVESVDKLLIAAEYGVPTNYAQGGMAGGTTPITAAGTLVLGNAECLFGLVLHQLKNPGAPFVYGFGNSPMDMISTQSAYATPLAIQIEGGVCDLGRFYGLPIWGESGNGCSKVCDEQAIMESSQFILMAAMQGCNLCHDVGYLDFGLSYSFELLVCCDEMIARTKNIVKELEVTPETMAVDIIKKVKHGGHYLGTKHTKAHWRENWRGELSDFNGYDDWIAKGSSTMAERAHEKIGKILESHTPEPLNEAVDREIEDILATARKEYNIQENV